MKFNEQELRRAALESGLSAEQTQALWQQLQTRSDAEAHFGPAALDRVSQLPAVYTGTHAQIGDHHVKRLLAQLFECLLAVGSRLDIETPRLDHLR